MDVKVVQGSLTDGDELVLVNASNTNASLGSGVSAAIRAACGADYQEYLSAELDEHKGGAMEPGDVLVTDTDTDAHRTVAMVALGAGVGGLGVATPTRIACETLRAHVDRGSKIAGVTFYGWSHPEYRAIADEVRGVFGDAVVG
jgi:O-acetyl-ADP-ribose deacetylase (regulator of RNase III)